MQIRILDAYPLSRIEHGHHMVNVAVYASVRNEAHEMDSTRAVFRPVERLQEVLVGVQASFGVFTVVYG